MSESPTPAPGGSENPFLAGNFAPVDDETTAFDLPVEGAIPAGLDGRLLRIGPNPIAPDPAGHHWFVGNGMVHGVRLRDGRAEWYRSRFVRDDEVVARRGGPPVEGPPALLGPGVANTHVLEIGGRIHAVVEAGNFPVELDDTLETLRRSDLGGTLQQGFSAHPKRCPKSGELHAAVYTPFDECVHHVVVGADGRAHRDVAIPMPHKPMIHDCAITDRYFVVLDFPCVFDAEAAMQGASLPYRWRPELGARVGLLPRDGAADAITWCEVEPCYVFHPMNAFEDAQGRVVLDVVRHPAMFASELRGPGEGVPVLERWLLDPRGGPVKTECVDERAQEFPRIDERRVGAPYRYGYSTTFAGAPGAAGLLKHDLQSGVTRVHDEGAHRFAQEPVFVPADEQAGEDEGWVLTWVHDARRNAADVVILDASDFEADPVATVRLPTRVPFGFHGSWVPDRPS